MLISFVGEILHALIPLSVPASIYGIIIMFAGLVSGLIPLSAVKETGKFLVDIMGVMFVPPAVGLMESWGLIASNWVPYIFISVASTFTVMIVAGHVTQAVIRSGRKKEVS